MRESELLSHIYRRSAGMASGPIKVGPGDDCAVIHLEGETLLTVDHLIEGRHFATGPDTPPPDAIARKAVARSVSDIAAMGGIPVCALAAACLPPNYAHAEALCDAVHRWGRHWGCPMVGGDIATADAPLVLSITVVGRAHDARGAVLRSGANVGDTVFVTGMLGGSLASGRHLTFEPRLHEARWLCDHLGGRLHAMLDLSDGLGRDSGRIAEASGVRIEFDAALLPRHPDVASWESCLRDGEDYELLFCASPGTQLPATIGDAATPVRQIGRVVAGSGSAVRAPDGRWVEIGDMGWDHGP